MTPALKFCAAAILLIPSALFVWRNSDAPQFGDLHDDGLYYVSAKSLAEGHYRIESLPGQPAQTKYPPLYPLLLSMAWRIDPHFPQNLPIAVWLSWAALPIVLVLFSAYYPRIGISGWRMWLVLALLALNPYMILFSSRLLSELWFTALLAAALILVERAAEDSAPGWAVAAGFVSGLAYLTRTAGIVLLVSGPGYLWMRGRRRHSALFAGAMVPLIAGWMLWSRTHMLATSDHALVYYVDYIKYEFYTVHLSNIHLVLWKNLDGVLWGLGSMILPKVTDSILLKITSQLLAVAMITGIVRLVKAGRAVHYAMFAVGAALMLVVWHFPPNERFVLPLVPLAFAGLLTEMEHFATNVKAVRHHKDRSQRVAGYVMAGAAALTFAVGFAMQAYVGLVFLNQSNSEQRVANRDFQAAYQWIRANVPAGDGVLTYTDPVLFLYTGHASIRRPEPPEIWYAEDHEAAANLYRDLGAYAREHGMSYIYYSSADGRRDMTDEDAELRDRLMSSNPDLMAISTFGKGTIYRVRERPTAAYTPAPISTIANPGQVVAGR